MTELTNSVVALALIPADEPIFVLRASDQHAAELVTRWAELTLASTGNALLARVGFDQAHAMRMWPHRRRMAGQEAAQGPIPGSEVSEAGG